MEGPDWGVRESAMCLVLAGENGVTFLCGSRVGGGEAFYGNFFDGGKLDGIRGDFTGFQFEPCAFGQVEVGAVMIAKFMVYMLYVAAGS